MAPTSSRTRGFVSCSSSMRTSQTRGSVETRSNRLMGGKRDAMTRHACGHTTRCVAMAVLGPGAAGGINVCPDGGKIGHVSGRHSLEGGLAAEETVGAIDPAIGL